MRALAEKGRAALEQSCSVLIFHPSGIPTLTLWCFQFTTWLSWEGWEAGVNA